MRRARMPALSRPALFRTALAAALAAITIPFIAHAAFGDETVITPTAQVFPTSTGIGVTWDPVDASAYRVERKQSTTDWQDISGTLGSSTTTWIDESLAAGATADYRVVATTPDPATSAAVTATRATETPSVGDTDVLALDGRRSDGVTWLQDETAGPVTASAPADGTRTLTAGSLKLKMPAFLAGPGYYEVPIELTQGARTCTTTGVFRVKELSYTPDLQLETFASSLGASCPGAESTAVLEIRFKSTLGYSLLSIAPEKLDAGRVMIGSTKSIPLTLKNTGNEPLQFGQIYLSGNDVWKIADRDCWMSLAPGASCTLTLKFEALGDYGRGDFSDRLVIVTSNSTQAHNVLMTGTSISLPKAPDAFNVVPTYTGVSLSWQTWKIAGGTPVRGYFLHRYLNGTETTQWIAPDQFPKEWMSLSESAPKPGTTYALSIVNEVGEGPAGPPKAPGRATDQIALTDGRPSDLMAATLGGYIVPFANSNSVTPKESVAAAPDGRSLAYVTTNGDKELWTQRFDPSGSGTAVKVWTTPAAITHLSWSPDGTRIAFQSPENDLPCVYTIAATGGTPEKVACDVTSPSWMPDARTLVVTDRRFDGDDRFARIQAAPGGTRVATLPAPTAAADGSPVRVSPDGKLVAFGSDRTIKFVDFYSSKVLSSLPLDATVRSISWNPYGGTLLALTGSGQMFQLNSDRLDIDPYKLQNEYVEGLRLDLAWQQLGLTIGQTPAVVGPQTSVTFDSSALMPGTTFSCGLPLRNLGPCTSPFTATDLQSGDNLLIIAAKEPDGRVTRAFRILTADATGPVARMTGPAYQSSVAATAKLTVAATDASGVASYDVRYRRASFAGPYSAYIQPWTNTTATSMDLAVAAGYEYCASVRAKDKLGNVGDWSAERCFSRPLDDRSMTMATTGWARGASSKFYFGTDTQTTASGKALTRTVQGKRFFLIATRCPSCGSVAVYAGNKYLTTVNLAYPTTHYQVVLGLPVQSTLFSGTLTFRTVSTGKLVQIDGLAVGRT
ncbi:hypothetical protein OG555_20220 [Kribbella sp. NBC_01484]|uniref:TolB family protein n=1 Tax=Kribbella sp. NBC_01484 TaxID=2903579 RepID=UPI002E32AD21|nr:hypothetical protein [Kribbella sp. NBC_01484]